MSPIQENWETTKCPICALGAAQNSEGQDCQSKELGQATTRLFNCKRCTQFVATAAALGDLNSSHWFRDNHEAISRGIWRYYEFTGEPVWIVLAEEDITETNQKTPDQIIEYGESDK